MGALCDKHSQSTALPVSKSVDPFFTEKKLSLPIHDDPERRFMKNGRDFFCQKHPGKAMRKMELKDYDDPDLPNYGGAYGCDVCGSYNGHSGKSGSIHCKECVMDICLRCIQLDSTYEKVDNSTLSTVN